MSTELELINVRLPLDAGLPGGQSFLEEAVFHALGKKTVPITSVRLSHLAVDARDKKDIHFVGSLVLEVASKSRAKTLLHRHKNIRPFAPQGYAPSPYTGAAPAHPPVIIGAGCAGLFCALVLAEAGLCPLVLERGERPGRRIRDIQEFNATGIIHLESNIQFGLGGAGTFSDGKLTTGTRSPYHRYIKETFVRAGAPEEILWRSKAHIGSDLLPAVVNRLADRIENAGGKILFGAKFFDFEEKVPGKLYSVRFIKDGREEFFLTETLFLATGHSARDVFTLLEKSGVRMERKSFAMGFRIEHLQEHVNIAQYGTAKPHPALSAAEYKLFWHGEKRTDAPRENAFTFCMCPGGRVENASGSPDALCTNGSSDFARNGRNANAALLVEIDAQFLPGSSVLAGMNLQLANEMAAYHAGGGAYVAPAQLLADYVRDVPSSAPGNVLPTFPRGVRWTNLRNILPPFIHRTILSALSPMAAQMHCFDEPDAVLTGIETRSSSPVRILRDRDSLRSLSHPYIFPVGEGAGYAGGIMSAAADGIRAAEAWMIAHDSER